MIHRMSVDDLREQELQVMQGSIVSAQTSNRCHKLLQSEDTELELLTWMILRFKYPQKYWIDGYDVFVPQTTFHWCAPVK